MHYKSVFDGLLDEKMRNRQHTHMSKSYKIIDIRCFFLIEDKYKLKFLAASLRKIRNFNWFFSDRQRKNIHIYYLNIGLLIDDCILLIFLGLFIYRTMTEPCVVCTQNTDSKAKPGIQWSAKVFALHIDWLIHSISLKASRKIF